MKIANALEEFERTVLSLKCEYFYVTILAMNPLPMSPELSSGISILFIIFILFKDDLIYVTFDYFK